MNGAVDYLSSRMVHVSGQLEYMTNQRYANQLLAQLRGGTSRNDPDQSSASIYI
jgi:hypothetical protein